MTAPNDYFDANGRERWHLSKAVPLSIIVFLFFQTIGLVIWATKLDSRVATLEKSELVQSVQINEITTLRDRLILFEERQNNVLLTLRDNGKKIDTLIDQLANKQNIHPY